MLIRLPGEPEGAPVTRGDPLYELDTDKVTQEVEAEADGVLLAVAGRPACEYLVGATIGWIGAPASSRRRSDRRATVTRLVGSTVRWNVTSPYWAADRVAIRRRSVRPSWAQVSC